MDNKKDFVMKKMIALVAFLTTVLTANAQFIQIGLTGDVAFDRAAGSGWEGFDKKFQPDMGWSAGLKMKISSNFGFGVDFGALFAQENKSFVWNYKNPISSSTAYDGTYLAEGRLNYLSVPVNLRFDLKISPMSRGFIPFVFVGPEFNWYFDGIEWSGEDAIKHAKEYVRDQTAIWNLNYGIGMILFKHFEIAYKHTVHLQDCFELKNDIGGKIESRFKNQTNKIALSIYF